MSSTSQATVIWMMNWNNRTILLSWGCCQCELLDSYSKHINIWIELIAVRKLVFVWTWDTAVGSWEVGVGAGRLWRTSSGGGTGKTTGEALDGSLFTSKTSMGPVELLRRIWYFLCPLRTWMRAQDPVWDTRHNSDWTKEAFKVHKPHIWLTDSGMGTSSCVPMGARIARSVSPEEDGEAGDEWQRLFVNLS